MTSTSERGRCFASSKDGTAKGLVTCPRSQGEWIKTSDSAQCSFHASQWPPNSWGTLVSGGVTRGSSRAIVRVVGCELGFCHDSHQNHLPCPSSAHMRALHSPFQVKAPLTLGILTLGTDFSCLLVLGSGLQRRDSPSPTHCF